jgi:two-component system chemotaxis response regulator CheB
VRQIKVLVVDDSALVREILSKGLAGDPALEVVGAARDPYEARDMIVKLTPDVVTLDVEMPRMNGVDFLKLLMPQHPIPIVMVSSLTDRGAAITLEALDSGAVDFVTKPKANVAAGLSGMMAELRTKVKIAATVNVSHWKTRREALFAASPRSAPAAAAESKWCKLIAMGASTGGTEALAAILCKLPPDLPPIVIVQHMPAGFTGLFAERINRQSQINVKEAAHGDVLQKGCAYVAPGGMQCEILKGAAGGSLSIKQGELCCGHAPSVEVMFRSAAKTFGGSTLGVILTGMGQDGAHGLKSLRDTGARTLGQDEASCVVYGMPKVAFEVGGVEKQLPLDRMADAMISLVRS